MDGKSFVPDEKFVAETVILSAILHFNEQNQLGKLGFFTTRLINVNDLLPHLLVASWSLARALRAHYRGPTSLVRADETIYLPKAKSLGLSLGLVSASFCQIEDISLISKQQFAPF